MSKENIIFFLDLFKAFNIIPNIDYFKESKIEEPKTEEHKTEEHKTEEPKIEEPKIEEHIDENELLGNFMKCISSSLKYEEHKYTKKIYD